MSLQPGQPDTLRTGQTRHDIWREIRSAIALIVVINLPFWLLSTRYLVLRPVFNADVALALLVAPLGAVAQIVAIVLVWLLDALQSMSFVYHFASATDFLATFEFAKHLGWADFLSVESMAITSGFAACLLLAAKLTRRSRPRATVVLGLFGLLVLADVVNGSGLPTLLGSDSFRLPVNIQGSPALNLASQLASAKERSAQPLTSLPSAGTPDPVRWAQQHPGGSVFVVLVESWGESVDPELQQWVRGKLATPTVERRWRVNPTTTPFRGSTTAGELRALCGLAGHYSRLTEEQSQQCLVQKIRSLGFETVAMHGFTGNMFNRTRWWPNLGFSKTVFAEDVPADAPRCGGAFQGICDSHMLSLASKELKHSALVYLLTLNTHLPLTVLPIPHDLAALCERRNVSASVCQLTSQIGSFMDSLATTLIALENAPFVIVSGDHSPPFVVQRDRDAFSQVKVPLLILEPK